MQQDLATTFALDGRVAVVTGAASGIGRETARVLAEAGARPVISDIAADGLDETAALVEATGVKPIVRRCDVSDRAQVEALASAALEEGGRLDVWANIAGMLVVRQIVDAVEDELDRMIAVNLKGVYWGCSAAGRAMKAAGRGSIINISSGGGESPVPGMSIYSLTKAAVNMLTRTTAAELGPFGVRANAVAPGWIDTPLANHGFRDGTGAIDPAKRDEGIALRARVSPLGLTGVPRDIALAVLYLASDASRFMTGQILRPNGGVAMP